MIENKVIMVLSSHTHSLFWFRMDMMKELVKKGYSVVAVGQENESEWKTKFKENGIDYRRIDVKRNGLNPLGDIKTFFGIYRLINEIKPYKIFCYQAKTVIYGCIAGRINGIKEIYPLIAGLGSVFRGDGLKNKIIRMLMTAEYGFSLKLAKSVMFQNNDDLSEFVSHKIVDGNKCGIINGSGVNIDRFSVSALPEKPVFLMITRLIRDKGVGEYLEASREIRKRHKDVRCLLVGPFDTNPSAITPEELQKYIDDGSIEYFGEQTDVKPYIDMSTVYVLPSYHEGTPKTVLEAMACGRAVITTDAPGCRETVKDGVNGILVKTKDCNAVAEAMERLIADTELCGIMGENGRKIVCEKYDVKKVNESIFNIMNV